MSGSQIETAALAIEQLDGGADSGALLSISSFLVEEIAGRVKAVWPMLRLDMDPFFRLVLAALDQRIPSSNALASLHIEDMFLAYACGSGDANGLKAFERMCVPELSAVAAQLRLSQSDCDDVRQVLWDKLFTTRPGCPARIFDYRGVGPLRHWFRVLATRSILSDLRRSRRSGKTRLHSSEVALSAPMTENDPELASVRRQYGKAFRSAFGTAILRLDPQERNFIKCHYLLGMTTSELGKAFGMHKATAARCIARTREKLLRDTREGIRASLRADTDELISIMRLFEEGLSTSLSVLLK